MRQTSRSRRLIFILLSLLCATSAAAAAPRRPSPHPPTPAPRVPTLQWTPCTAEIAGVQCATAQVPLDYNNPYGPQISLALARLPARKPAQRIGSLFMNPGGPGGSGVDLIKTGFTNQMSPEVLDRFDIVGWDPRGVGASTPLLCWGSDAERNAYFANSPVFPWRADQEAGFYNLQTTIRGLCAARGQTIMNYMSTAEVARDLDLLRQAAGDARLNYLGYSYGTYLGETYANLFPMQIRAMVLDSVIDPEQYADARMLDTNRASAGIVMQQFIAQCEAAGTRCPLNGNGGPALRFSKILDALRNGATLTYQHPDEGLLTFTYDNFIAYNSDTMSAPEVWRMYATMLAALSDGLPKAAASILPKRRAPTPRTPGWSVSPGNFTEAFLGSHCSDARYPSSLSAFSQRGRDAATSSVQGPLWAWEPAGCASWPSSPRRYQGPWHLTTVAPVLMINSRYDSATTLDGAVRTNRLMPNSRLLTYEGWGHGIAYTRRSTCVSDATTRYLIDGTLPASGAVCPLDTDPFALAKRPPESAYIWLLKLSGARRLWSSLPSAYPAARH